MYHAVLPACVPLVSDGTVSRLVRADRPEPRGMQRGGAWRRLAMKKLVSACVLTVLAACPAWSATVTNTDGETAVLIVVEGENRMEVAISAGGTDSICPSGCFITTPSGDRVGLQGDETIEIVKGSAVFK